MQLGYLFTGDDLPITPITPIESEDGGGWWAGAQKCAATVASAVVLAGSLLASQVGQAVANSHQDDFPQTGSQVSDSGQIRSMALTMQPVYQTNLWLPPLQHYEQNEIVAAQVGGVGTTVLLDSKQQWPNNYQNLPYPFGFGFEDFPVQAAPPTFAPDEDYWQGGPPLPVQALNLPIYLPDPEEIPAGSLFGQPDEDFWQNPVAPLGLSFFRPYGFGLDPEELPAGSLFGQPDEDYWINAVAPVPPSLYQRFPAQIDGEEVPAGSLFGQPDEDFWVNPVAPVSQTFTHLLGLGLDPEEIPAGSLFGVPEELYWQNPVQPVQASLWQPLPYLPDPTQDILPQPGSGNPDEDYWQNPAAPVAASFYQRLPLGDPEEIPANTLHGQPDEDFWANPVAPVPAILGRLYGFGWDIDDVPAGALHGQPDEDYWQNPVVPVAASMVWPQPWTFDVQEPAGSFHGQPDEDFDWSKFLGAPRPTVLNTTPAAIPQWQYDVQEPAGSLAGSPDEDFWPVWNYGWAPVNRWAKIFSDEDFVNFVPLPVQEDYWQNWVGPIAPSIYQPLPYLPDYGQSSEIMPFGRVVEVRLVEVTPANPVAAVSAAPAQTVQKASAEPAQTVKGTSADPAQTVARADVGASNLVGVVTVVS